MNDEADDTKESTSQQPEGSPGERRPIGRWDEESFPIYTHRAEKRRDFWAGFGLWFGLNIMLYLLNQVVLILVARRGPSFVLLSLVTLLINLILPVYFAFTRRSFALGMLAAFGSALFLGLCATLLFRGICFI